MNEAKIILADHATSALHGTECLISIKATVASLFSDKGGEGGSNLESLEKFQLPADTDIDNGLSVVDVLLAGDYVHENIA